MASTANYNRWGSEAYSLDSASSTRSCLPQPGHHESTGMGSDRQVWGPKSALSKPTVLDVELEKQPTQHNPHQEAHFDVQRLRIKVTLGRLDLRQRRTRLREQRQKTVDHEVEFYESLQRSWTLSGKVEDSSLSNLVECLHEARDQLGPMEEDYNEAEDDLDELEYELETQEKKFYSRPGNLGSVGDSSSPKRGSSSEGTQQRSLSYTVWDAAKDSSPRARYLSRVGDANILRERLEDLTEEQNECLEREQQRRSYSLLPYPPNVDFIANFPLVYTKLMEELLETEDDIRRLRDEAGIINSNHVGEIAPTTPSSMESISQPQRVLFAIEKRLQQGDMQRSALKYAASDAPLEPDKTSISTAFTYPFASRSPPSFRQIPQGHLDGKRAEQLRHEGGFSDTSYPPKNANLMLGMHTAPAPNDGTKDKPNLVSNSFQPPASDYALQSVVPSIPSQTSVPSYFNSEPARRNGVEEQGEPLTALKRVNQWMLDRLRCSKIEQASHKAYLDKIFLDDREWWTYVEHCWPLDQAGGTLRAKSQGNSRMSISEYSAQTDIPTFNLSEKHASYPFAKIPMQTPVHPTKRHRSASSGLITPSYFQRGEEFITSKSI